MDPLDEIPSLTPPLLRLMVKLIAVSVAFLHAGFGFGLVLREIQGDVIRDSYIVKLKDSVATDSHISILSLDTPITNRYGDDFFKGYAGIFTKSELHSILSSPDVEFVEPNAIVGSFLSSRVTLTEPLQSHLTAVETVAPWGLQRISSRAPVWRDNARALNSTYTYEAPAGEGVDIYMST